MKILLLHAVGMLERRLYIRRSRFLLRASLFMPLFMAATLELSALDTSGQSIDNVHITLGLRDAKLTDVLRTIQNETGISFVFTPDHVRQYTNINLSEKKRTVRETLDRVLEETVLTFREVKNKTVVIYKRKSTASSTEQPTSTATILPRPDIRVTGTVTDAKTSVPIPGVSIQIKGTANGTTTDGTGNYSLSTDEFATLVFTSIGYSTVELPVSNRSSIDVQMVEDMENLKEVIIKANYYDVNDRDNVGNISTVSANVIRRQPVSNPLQAMQGRVPGMYISQTTGMPGGNFHVRIRGTNSINNGNNPLYIIDGIPYPSESLSNVNTSGTLYGYDQGVSPLNSINPNDIESISILKDAEATAIYGSRGANGVVLIVTKRGRAGKVAVSADVRSGVSFVGNRVKLLNTEQYLDMRYEAVANDGDVGPLPTEYDINGTWDQSRYTDWQKELIGGMANMTTINTSISGGNNDTQFLFSVGHDRQTTVTPGTNSAKKFSTHFSISHTSLNKNFTTRLSTTYTINTSDLTNADLSQIALLLAPNAPKLYDENNELNWENSTWKNPLADLRGRFNANTTNLITNAEFSYQIRKCISIKANVGVNDFQNEEKKADPSSKYPPSLGLTSAISQLAIGRGTTRSWIAEPQLSISKQVNKAKIDALIGATYQYRVNEGSENTYTGFPSNTLIYDPRSAASARIDSYNYNQYRYAALYSRFSFIWDEKYIITLTGRRDGSSRFGPGRRFANLGAIGLGWIFTNESYIKKNLPLLSLGKIRLSYGITGNDQIGDYQFMDIYRSAGASYQGVNGLVAAQLFNPDYGWETNKKLEGAIETGMIDNRIRITASFYLNRSSNQLIDYSLPSTSGLGSVLRNSPATVENRGIELELNTTNIIQNYFEWSTSLNVTIPQNRLVSFPNIESSSYNSRYEIGKPLSIQKVFHYEGLDPATGLYQFTDANNDREFTAEDKRTAIVLTQKSYGGINNSFSYKGFQLDIFVQFVTQKKRDYEAYILGYPGQNFNQPEYIFNDRWKEPGNHAQRQSFSRNNIAAMNAYNTYKESDAVISDASFIRLKNVSLNYQLPKPVLKSISGRIYLQCQNIVTVTKYFGLDPESNPTRMPPLTTIVLGTQLNL